MHIESVPLRSENLSFCLKKCNRDISFTLDSQPLLYYTCIQYSTYTYTCMRMRAHAAYKIAVIYFSLLKLFRFFSRGLRQPRKYFDNKNFQIYSSTEKKLCDPYLQYQDVEEYHCYHLQATKLVTIFIFNNGDLYSIIRNYSFLNTEKL